MTRKELRRLQKKSGVPSLQELANIRLAWKTQELPEMVGNPYYDITYPEVWEMLRDLLA